MKNQVIINSKTPEIITAASAIHLKNEFLEMGFTVRATVIDLIVEHFPKYANSRDITRLQNWWISRVHDEAINSDVEMVINKLKHE